MKKLLMVKRAQVKMGHVVRLAVMPCPHCCVWDEQTSFEIVRVPFQNTLIVHPRQYWGQAQSTPPPVESKRIDASNGGEALYRYSSVRSVHGCLHVWNLNPVHVLVKDCNTKASRRRQRGRARGRRSTLRFESTATSITAPET